MEFVGEWQEKRLEEKLESTQRVEQLKNRLDNICTLKYHFSNCVEDKMQGGKMEGKGG